MEKKRVLFNEKVGKYKERYDEMKKKENQLNERE